MIGSQLCTIRHREEAITFIFLRTEKFDKVDTWHIELLIAVNFLKGIKYRPVELKPFVFKLLEIVLP